MRRQTFIALLRGVNVAGKHKIPMAELRSICASVGCDDVRTYIQSGNAVFMAVGSAAMLEKKLEQAIEQSFRFGVPVIVRSASQWGRYVEESPLRDEAEEEPGRVQLAVSKRPPNAGAAKELQPLATQGERIVLKGDAIWVHYANGIGRSKLTPAVLDRCVGSPVTSRNWRTVLELREMLRHQGKHERG